MELRSGLEAGDSKAHRHPDLLHEQRMAHNVEAMSQTLFHALQDHSKLMYT